MPEKPEVLTVAKSLKKEILGKKIVDVEILWENIIENPSPKEFRQKIRNQVVENITTRGKWIVVHLTDKVLLIHLRMEGKFFFREKSDPINKHEHVIFTLDDGRQMRFHDVRKFGKMHLLDKDNYLTMTPLKEIGYEYNDSHLTSSYLRDKLKKKSVPIKTSLLDQSIIAGIGNIYDDEILYFSKINPNRKSNTITEVECLHIIENTKVVLDRAIELGGTTIKSFTSSEGVHGLFQHELSVHGKKDGLCPKCKTKIEVVKINGRSTYYCPKCQK